MNPAVRAWAERLAAVHVEFRRLDRAGALYREGLSPSERAALEEAIAAVLRRLDIAPDTL